MGLFIRSLTGMDRKAAKSALGEFTAGRNLTANQMEFIDLIIEHLTKEGTIEPPLLFESPFTDQNEQGVGGLFQTDEVKALVQILNGIKERVEV